MTEENQTQDDGQQADEDSGVIQAIRRENRELKKKLKGEEQIRQEARAEVLREQTVQSALDELGLPSQMVDKLELPEDGEIDRDVIAESVQEQFGLDPAALSQPSSEPTQDAAPQPTEQQQDLQRVSDLSSRVRAVADGGEDPAKNLSKKINSAQTQEELVDALSEHGLTGSSY